MESGSDAFAITIAAYAARPTARLAPALALALHGGQHLALPYLLGKWGGELVWLVAGLAGLGLGLLGQHWGLSLRVVAAMGAVGLGTLAWRMWQRPAPEPVAGRPLLVLAGAGVTLGAPGTILFSLAILPLLVDPSAMSALSLIGVGATVLLAVVIGDLIWTGAVIWGRRLLPAVSGAGWRGRVAGAVIALAAVLILTEVGAV